MGDLFSFSLSFFFKLRFILKMLVQLKKYSGMKIFLVPSAVNRISNSISSLFSLCLISKSDFDVVSPTGYIIFLTNLI